MSTHISNHCHAVSAKSQTTFVIRTESCAGDVARLQGDILYIKKDAGLRAAHIGCMGVC